MNAVQNQFLARLEGLTQGRLRLQTPQGVWHSFGDHGPEAEIVIRDWALISAVIQRGDVGFGESYVAGHWDSPDLEALLCLALRNMAHFGDLTRQRGVAGWMLRINDFLRGNSVKGASRNIQAHYDVGNEFYQLWLDPGMTYSSGLFSDTDDLETAQMRKNDRILSRLGPGESVLEIGCGWGGFAQRASQRGLFVTGLTLSPAQKGYADARLDGRADIRLQDYRHCLGQYDNIVSIEMIEAVGEKYWPTYFSTLKQRLAPQGRAVIQAITVADAEFSLYRQRSDFIRQHIFPGGMLPSPAILAHHGAQAGLKIANSFAFGQDYARTCRIWAQRLAAAAPRIHKIGYDEKFMRSWKFYLEGCAATFATGRTDVVQIEFAHAAAA